RCVGTKPPVCVHEGLDLVGFRVELRLVNDQPRNDIAALDRLKAPQLRSASNISEDISTLVGFGMSGNILKQPTGASSSETLIFGNSRWPRFVQSPIDAYSLLNPPRSLGGVLTDDAGLLYAFWTSFAFPDGNDVNEGEWGMPADILRQALEDYRAGDPHYALDAALSYVPLYEARMMGLSPGRTAELAGLDVRQRRALYVRQVQDSSALQVGDVLVAVDGQVINSLRALEIAVQKPQVVLTVLRNGEEHDVKYLTEALTATGAERVVSWNGVYVQEITREVRHKMAKPVEGVYISSIEPGSPTLQENLYPNRLITAVDGVPVASLDQFVEQLKNRSADDTVRLSTHLLSNYQQLVSVDVQPAFWPNFELRRAEDASWSRSRW
ncbi:MAG: PDZ domain-containing protein, partial [Granulosicoccaceae bacterium]